MADDPSPTPFQRKLPNALTMARVGLAAGLFAVLSVWDAGRSAANEGGVDWVLLGAAAIFVVAALTDLLDGNLARRWKVVSVFGRIMDPFADKLLVLGSFLFLAGPGFALPGGRQLSGVVPWMAAVVLGRELLVTHIRAAFESRGVDFSASLSGKLKMIVQSVGVPAILVVAAMPYDEVDRAAVNAWIAWAVVIVTVWSGVPYVTRAMRAGAET